MGLYVQTTRVGARQGLHGDGVITEVGGRSQGHGEHILGQLGMGMLIDNFGWLGNPAIELSGSRVVAMLLLALALHAHGLAQAPIDRRLHTQYRAGGNHQYQ